MTETNIEKIIEALLFASGNEGLTIRQLEQILNEPAKRIKAAMAGLARYYEQDGRGLRIMQSDQAYIFTTKPELSAYCQKLLENPHAAKLSQAALETLAIIAYKQPITKTEIEEIRGVKSDRPIHTLISKMLIEEVGRKETTGRPILFGTTNEFLLAFGLASVHELPPLPAQGEEGENPEADLFSKTLQAYEEAE